MNQSAETEIKRLTAAATEPGSVEASIRAAMQYAFRESAAICTAYDPSGRYSVVFYIRRAIEERLKP